MGDNSVLDLLNSTTDNEIAVIGCVAALLGSAGLMVLSGALFGGRRAAARSVPAPHGRSVARRRSSHEPVDDSQHRAA